MFWRLNGKPLECASMFKGFVTAQHVLYPYISDICTS